MFFLGDMSAQLREADNEVYEDAPFQNAGYDWTVKVLWIDIHGKKNRTKGKVLLAHGNGIMIRELSASGRSTSQSIPAHSIIKLKYGRSGEGNGIAPDVLTGAFDGALNGGFVQIQTGNVALDLLSGVLQGAFAGLLSSPRETKRVVWVNRDREIYRDRVLPELGFVASQEDVFIVQENPYSK